ncbi:hypothetical protein UFOVP978_61 [uncultured Caudovirales phage]|uniref:PD-(D/E)XK nuclease superfamily n=1 Tax=uncultured Caudovirales phage TaxID=2100421 RepID=A0A6J5Q055_9CAUD|nr:hypothetical protein UFOVP978_61 [uncultured Caudovirales phage]
MIEMELDPFKRGRSGRIQNPPVVVPMVEEYLATHNGLTVTDKYADTLVRLTATPPRDRTGSFSASSRGGCERAQVFQYLNHPQDNRPVDTTLQSVFLDGTWRHIRWQMLLLAAGEAMGSDVQVEVPFRRDDLRLRGSLDGIVDGRGFELKGTRAFQGARSRPFSAHTLQVHSYMVLADLDIFSVVYEDKATQQTVEHVVKRTQSTIDKVMNEIGRLNTSIDTEILPEILSGCSGSTKSQQWWDCAYRSSCGSQDFESAHNLA